MKKLLFALIAAAVLGSGLLTAGPAAASFYNRGVKDVDYAWATDACAPDLFDCTPGAGEGPANVLRIVQEPAAGGGLEFADYETTARDDDDIWFAATIGAECRVGYSLSSVWIRPEWAYESYQIRTPEQIELGWYGHQVSIPNARVMPEKLIAVDFPVDETFGSEHDSSLVLDFDSLEDVYAYGESVIADRIASGMSESAARADGFTFDTWVATHARVGCEGNVSGHAFIKKMPQYLPLSVEFVPVPQTPVGGNAVGGDVVVDTAVHDATLNVIPDPDACTLHLSAMILANGDTEVEYRFTDLNGGYTPTYRLDVQTGLPAFVSHEVAVPSAGGAPDGPSLVAEDGRHDLDDLVGHPTDRITGVYQLEVLSPNSFGSNIDGFSVEPCTAPATAIQRTR